MRALRRPSPRPPAAGAPAELWSPPRQGVWPPLYHLSHGLFRLVMPRWYGVTVTGREHLPRTGGALVVVNHLADVDPPFLAWACMPRRLQYLALARHFRRRPLALLLSGLGAFPVREGGDHRALRHARDEIRAGRLVLIFPEGRPSFSPRVGPFAEGMGTIALAADATVLPAAIWGAHRVVRGRLPLGRGPVSVAFGPPLEARAEGTRRARAADITLRSREAVEALLAELVARDPDPPGPAGSR